ncbi:MAG TPA: amylo-alpha-1,6-glucosidase [Chloroflexota bacterium]|nr:amylo-alpha-1,6-glucosidase [Chloroflexota bacterium]
MIVVGRETCCDLDAALGREWLVTNGIGGYASCTVAGVNTRRYHGLLVAALGPLKNRTAMLSRLEEEVVVEDRTFYLGVNEYHDGTINPHGYIHLEECRIEDGIPTFLFGLPEAELRKTIWMEHGQNTTYVQYALSEGSQAITLRLNLFVTYRDANSETNGMPDWVFNVREEDAGLAIQAFSSATPLRIRATDGARFFQTGVWYWRYLHRHERERGLDYLEDLYNPGVFVAELSPGTSVTVQMSAEEWSRLPTDLGDALSRRRARQRKLWTRIGLSVDDDLRDLVVAADQFVVQTPDGSAAAGGPRTGIIAGYHWFGEWGRDAVIALPGVLLSTGRVSEAADLLRRYAGFVDHGMLPNRIPDGSAAPEYNTVDATLWYFQALEHYLEVSRDDDLLTELYPTLESMIHWHQIGTRFGIVVDQADGLLTAGVPGEQLTWMDARVGDWCVTARQGKPVEVNALWYNALRLMEGWSRRIGRPYGHYREAADWAYASFNDRFWSAEQGHLYDVVDGDNGNDASLRPNQIFAIALIYPTLDPRRWESVLGGVERELLTPYGLRTLAPESPGYVGRYGGDQRRRDGAYHQGTVWPWLFGPYAEACRRAARDIHHLRSWLDDLIHDDRLPGLGSLCEIFDGDPPHQPNGCIAQAWSVGEVLRIRRQILQE